MCKEVLCKSFEAGTELQAGEHNILKVQAKYLHALLVRPKILNPSRTFCVCIGMMG